MASSISPNINNAQNMKSINVAMPAQNTSAKMQNKPANINGTLENSPSEDVFISSNATTQNLEQDVEINPNNQANLEDKGQNIQAEEATCTDNSDNSQSAQSADSKKPNLGVLEGPNNYSKTPITDTINKQKEETPRTKLPKKVKEKNKPVGSPTGKKLTSGQISALCSMGSLAITLTILIPKGISKIKKIIKHK